MKFFSIFLFAISLLASSAFSDVRIYGVWENKDQKIIGIAGIDTRALTHHLRISGAQSGCIMSGNVNEREAIKKAKSFIELIKVSNS